MAAAAWHVVVPSMVPVHDCAPPGRTWLTNAAAASKGAAIAMNWMVPRRPVMRRPAPPPMNRATRGTNTSPAPYQVASGTRRESAVSQMSNHRPAIEVTALKKVYVTKRGTFRRTRVDNVALGGIDLAIQPGELFGLLGPNGAGKTTTTKILTTLLLPDSGQACVLGLDVGKQTDAVRRRLGFVFGGDRGLYCRLSGLDNLRYFADLYRIPPDVSRRRIAELLDRLGLAGREDGKGAGYASGKQQPHPPR